MRFTICLDNWSQVRSVRRYLTNVRAYRTGAAGPEARTSTTEGGPAMGILFCRQNNPLHSDCHSVSTLAKK